MGLVVQKYGGSSVADTDKIRHVAGRVIECKKKGNDVVVVVSAMGDTTDDLIALAKSLTQEPSDREMDVLMSTGEQISMSLLAMCLEAMGYPSVSLTGSQAGIRTSGVHRKARILSVDPKRVREELEKGKIVVVAGFQGMDEKGDITTLGRGGSDTTAVALAAALEADVCEIYTDVDGVYTANPRVVKNARKLDVISYDEMLEMANLGAQVLQPRAVEFAKMHGVKICVRSTFSSDGGSMVMDIESMERGLLVTGVAHETGISKFAVLGVPDQPGTAYTLFSALAEQGINVDIIVQSATEGCTTDMLFTVSQDDHEKTKKILENVVRDLGATGILCSEGLAKVSIIGAGMASNPGVAARMFGALAREKVNILAISTSEIRISCIIEADAVERAVNVCHEEFGLDKA